MALFIQLVRSKETEELMRHPKEFMLLTQIALRASRGDDAFSGLAAGESMIGDHVSIGLSKQNYRTAKANIQKWNFATFRVTNRGTIAKLTDSRVYDINISTSNTPANTQPNTQLTLQLTPNNNINNLITNTPPIIPHRGSSKDKAEIIIPDVLKDSPEFLTAWTAWTEYRKTERRKPVSPTAAARQLKKLAVLGPAAAVAMINQSIDADWTGLFPVKAGNIHTQTNSQSKFSGRF